MWVPACTILSSCEPFDVAAADRRQLELWIFTNIFRLNQQRFQQLTGITVQPSCATPANLRPLAWCSALYQTSRGHAQDMAACGRLSHDSCNCPTGACSFDQRIKSRYRYNTAISENVAVGSSTSVGLLVSHPRRYGSNLVL